MLERIDKVTISGDFELEEAISSLRFYFNLARQKNPYGNYPVTPLIFELWGEKETPVSPAFVFTRQPHPNPFDLDKV